ncbi:formylglycine-generating enzyme family protein [Roseomonas stagni]|uniref:Formylglycine-generating enzyme family protein n=1 Tax=Falsiroseomonas algicola TaxID=2716930 RepID=A0A6M1LWB2_9PROT|nr:SUMF1/EgtB/PvdO family nonheme iron enzyme [Falsiroseomonas algicola]NGM24309.1 formylglycine-generating enzyme family protein [Falsiroseomonas algicola]
MSSRLAVFGLLIALLPGPVPALGETLECTREPSERWVWDPCPSSEGTRAPELTLPLPGHRYRLILRRVEVPGPNFWCEAERNVLFGRDDPGDPFAAPQRVQIGGAFRTSGGSDAGWKYYIAKYEFTAGQAAAILGNGVVSDGVARLVDMLRRDAASDRLVAPLRTRLEQLPPEEGPARWSRLAEPLRGLTAAEIGALLESFNTWCYRDPECLGRLRQQASLAGVPGFLRLPTEAEWEYAARGGLAALRSGRFSDDRFWNTAPDHFRFAVSRTYERWPGNAVQRIGGERRSTPGGLFDVLGNVRELTADVFGAEMRQGKSGGLSARGGAFSDDASRLTVAMRDEVPAYRWDTSRSDGAAPAFQGVNRDLFLGLRPVMASVNVPTAGFRREVFADVAAACRATTPAALSAGAGAAPVADDMRRMTDRLRLAEEEGRGQAELRRLLSEISRRLFTAERTLRDRDQRLCQTLFFNAVTTAQAVTTDLRDRNRREWWRQELVRLNFPAERVATAQRERDHHARNAQERIRLYEQTLREMTDYGAECQASASREMRRRLQSIDVMRDELELVSLVDRHITQVRSLRPSSATLFAEIEAIAGSLR